jgi:FkbM family methyltransferase
MIQSGETKIKKPKGRLALARQVFDKIWLHPGNRHGRLRALARSAAWQLYKRVGRRPLRVDFVDGFSVLCFPDSGSASNIFYRNHYFELEEMTLLRRVLRPGDGFIDGGANIGVYSMLAGCLVGRSGRVIAFEPSPTHAARVIANAELNGFDQVEARRAALAAQSGTVSFVTTRDVSNRIQTRTDADADTIEVECTTLDDAISGMPEFTIAKLDLEGSEIDALHGAERLLGEGGPVMWFIEWNIGLIGKRGHRPAELIDLLAAHGLRLVAVDGDRLVPAEPPEWHGNIIAVRTSAIPLIEARLRERPTVAPAKWTLPRRASLSSAA